MSAIISLFGFLPPPRDDGIPWTGVVLEESAAETGPWAQIDVQTLESPDADPSDPAYRSVVTRNATLEHGWYRVAFTDDGQGRSVAGHPVFNGPVEAILPPSPDTVRNLSRLLRGKLPVPKDDPFAAIDLRAMTAQATALVQSMTWRLIDPSLGCSAPEGYVCEAVPDALKPVAVQAIVRMVERLLVTTEPAFAEQAATGRRLRGFSAGPYSESYFAPGEFARRGAQQGRPAMDPDEALDLALWALATEDARDYFVWRSTGVAPPTGVATAFDYRRQSRGYGAGGSGLPFDGLGRGGPDGL